MLAHSRRGAWATRMDDMGMGHARVHQSLRGVYRGVYLSSAPRIGANPQRRGSSRLRRAALRSRRARTVARLLCATVRARQGAAPPRPPTVRGRSAKRYPHGTYVPAYRLSAPLTHVRTRVHIDDDRRRTSTHTHTRMHTHRRWSTALSKTPALSKSPASPQGRFGSTTGSETPEPTARHLQPVAPPAIAGHRSSSSSSRTASPSCSLAPVTRPRTPTTNTVTVSPRASLAPSALPLRGFPAGALPGFTE
jgi:hypothetical protein